MLAIASRNVSRTWQLIHLLSHNPEYVLGRFAAVRDAYSALRSLRDTVEGGVPLRMGDLYKEPTAALAVASSGYLVPQKPVDGQVIEMREHSYSVGPHIVSTVGRRTAESVQDVAAQGGRARRRHLRRARDIARTLRPYRQCHGARLLEIGDRTGAGGGSVAARCGLVVPRLPSGEGIELAVLALRQPPIGDERRARNQTIDFHYDVDGYNFMYANFYLNHTTARNGAHVLIDGSSRRKHGAT